MTNEPCSDCGRADAVAWFRVVRTWKWVCRHCGATRIVPILPEKVKW